MNKLLVATLASLLVLGSFTAIYTPLLGYCEPVIAKNQLSNLLVNRKCYIHSLIGIHGYG